MKLLRLGLVVGIVALVGLAPTSSWAATKSTLTATPSTGLIDGQTVTVHLTGFTVTGLNGAPSGTKVFLSECDSATFAASPGGCGGQLAAQPFAVTDDTGSATLHFVVSAYSSGPLVAGKYSPPLRCAAACVLVASGFDVFAPLQFASTLPFTGAPTGMIVAFAMLALLVGASCVIWAHRRPSLL